MSWNVIVTMVTQLCALKGWVSRDVSYISAQQPPNRKDPPDG